jgi:hypothetical protein
LCLTRVFVGGIILRQTPSGKTVLTEGKFAVNLQNIKKMNLTFQSPAVSLRTARFDIQKFYMVFALR